MSSTKALAGKVAIVTGGNSGIGLGIARALARAGASICIWSRNSARNRDACEELRTLGVRAEACECDVTIEASVEFATARAVDMLGRIDMCFASAGTTPQVREPITQFDVDAWRTIFAVNVEGALLAVKHVVRRMESQRSGGKLVLISSIAAHLGLPALRAYAASKASLEALCRCLAVELAPAGIQVNAIAPGFIDTPLTRRAGEQFATQIRQRVPAHRLGDVADLEAVALLLASPDSQYLTGQCITVDGGYSIT
jgi:NAD(P)-dependent dehydrogenase (short-subunit alcohol dehydrogenase family)